MDQTEKVVKRFILNMLWDVVSCYSVLYFKTTIYNFQISFDFHLDFMFYRLKQHQHFRCPTDLLNHLISCIFIRCYGEKFGLSIVNKTERLGTCSGLQFCWISSRFAQVNLTTSGFPFVQSRWRCFGMSAKIINNSNSLAPSCWQLSCLQVAKIASCQPKRETLDLHRD